MSDTKKFTKKTEIIRFTICGLIAALINFIFYTLTAYLLPKAGLDKTSIYLTIIATAVGFIVSVIANYFMSILWVFKNIDKKEQEKHKKRNIWIFILLSLIGLFISLGVMAMFKAIFLYGCNINIDDWMNVTLDEELNFFMKLIQWISKVLKSATFWCYAFSFVIQAIAGLIFNYISRKKLLFKEPKKYGNNKI